MPRSIASITLLMHEHDEAIQFFTEALRFELLEDTPLGDGKRWVRVAQSGSNRSCPLLARAAIPEQLEHVGDQTDGHVFLFLETDDF